MVVLLAGAGSAVDRVWRAPAGSAARAARRVRGCSRSGIAARRRRSGAAASLVAGLAVYGLGLGGERRRVQHAGRGRRAPRRAARSCRRSTAPGPRAGIVATLGAIARDRPTCRRPAAARACSPLAVLAAPFLRRDHGSDPATPTAEPPAVGVPLAHDRCSWACGLVLFYMVDTAVDRLGTGLPQQRRSSRTPDWPAMYALATLPYLVATLLARLAGDRAAGAVRGRRPRASRARRRPSSGLAVIVFAPPRWPVAVLGSPSSALGVAVIAPLTLLCGRLGGRRAASTRRPGAARVDAVVARFNQFNYAGGAARCGAHRRGRHAAPADRASPCRWSSCSACSRWPATSASVTADLPHRTRGRTTAPS